MQDGLRTARRAGLATIALVLALASPPAFAADTIVGPMYPLPVAHGGDTCFASGNMWTFGGGNGTTDGPSCNGTASPPPFDTTKFKNLYWGLDPTKPPHTETTFGSATLAFDAAASNGAGGVIAFTNGPFMLRLTVTDSANQPVALATAASVGLPAAVGYAVSVTNTLTNFKVSHQWLYNGQPFETVFVNCNPGGLCFDNTSFDGAFWYVDAPPTGDFSFSTPANHQPMGFTATGLTDPDGAIASYSWDLNGDGTYGDSPNGPATQAFGPGDHTVGLEIVDNEGTMTPVIHTFHIDNQAPTGDFTCTPGSPTSDDTVTCTASASDPDAAAGDPAPTLEWDWNGNNAFGDAGDQTGSAPSGKFPVGATVVTLRITDRDGATKTVSHTVTATAPPAPPGTGGTGGGGPTGGGGGDTSGSADHTPPALTIVIAKQKLKSARKSGIAGTVKSNEAGSCVLTLTVPAKIAKKLKLKGPVGTLKLTLTAGRVKGFKLKLSKAAATKLAKLRSISFVLSARCKDAAGNAGKASKAFRLK